MCRLIVVSHFCGMPFIRFMRLAKNRAGEYLPTGHTPAKAHVRLYGRGASGACGNHIDTD